MKKIITCTLILCVTLLSGCKEDAPKLKTVDYWLENQQEMRDLWMTQCKDAMEYTDNNCKVIEILMVSGIRDHSIKLARENYERIVRESERGR